MKTGTYKFIDHTADIAVEVAAVNYEDLFVASFLAWKEAAIGKLDLTNPQEKVLEINDNSIEELLVHFLSELNYFLLGKKWITAGIKEIKINLTSKEWNFNAIVSGEPFNEQKHKMKIEIKAVTFHQMEVKFIDGKYKTRIIFDI